MYSIINHNDVENSFFLSGRNVGASRKLRGNIATISCLIKNDANDFSEETQYKYFCASNQAHRWLEEQAKKYNVSLKIQGYHFKIDAPKDMNEDFSWEILKDFFNRDTMESLQEKYEFELNFDETPFLAVFDQHSRSFAWMQRKAYPYHVNELSTISRYHDNYYWQTIAHELLHQFGAVDLYYPDRIQQYADRYLGDSIMGDSQREMDDLTAYLIGWTDTISNNAYTFLKETMWYTKVEYEKALQEAWKQKF